MSNDSQAHESHLLVTFTFDGTDVRRYTDSSIAQPGFTSVPNMEASGLKNSGTLDSPESRIVLPADEWLIRVASGVPHSPIKVRIQEITITPEGTTSGNILFDGDVEKAIRNFQRKKNRVAILMKREQGQLDGALGLRCTHQCQWTVFGRGCGLNRDSFGQFATVDTIDGNVLTTLTIGLPGKPADYWNKGYVEYNDLRIGIRSFTNTLPLTLVLNRRAPDDWIGKSIRVVPGCIGTYEMCGGTYSNTDRFMGPGYAIPAHDPTYEQGEG